MKRLLLITFLTSSVVLALSLLAATGDNGKASTVNTNFAEQATVATDINISSGL